MRVLILNGAVGCLLVVLDGRLIGIVSEHDFLPLAARWLAGR